MKKRLFLKNWEKKIAFMILALVIAFNLSAEIFGSETWGYNLDLPEGFALIDSKSDNRFLLRNNILSVELQISLDTVNTFKNETALSETIFKQLSAQHKDITFLWCGRPAQLSTITFQATSSKGKRMNYAGWLLVLKLDKEQGWLSLITYVPEEMSKKLEPMMISTLDSVYTSQASFFSPGPVTSALYPATGLVKAVQKFDGKEIVFFYDKSDMQANQSVVDREFKLLVEYQGTAMAIEAWKRYYRNIFRDSWQRMESLAFTLKTAMFDTPAPPKSSLVASKLLNHLQNFLYVRDHSGADFINIPKCYIEKTGDCDARSVLMCVILRQLGIDCVLAVSPEFSHAIAAVDCKGAGAKFSYANKKYLVAETTSKIEIGQIVADLADPSKWFIVEFYGLPKKN